MTTIRPSKLSDFDLSVLDFEKRRWAFSGLKQQAILQTFGFSETRYYQELRRLLDDPEALKLEPAMVNRLRRILLEESN